MKTPNFLRDLKDGEFAEEIVMEALSIHLEGNEAIGRAPKGEKYYDFCLMVDGGGQITFEVKFDKVAARTGNIFFEILSNAKRLHLGAGIYSRADWLALVIPVADGTFDIHMIKFEKLKAFMLRGFLAGEFKTKSVRFNKECKGIVIPLKMITELVESKINYNIIDDSIKIDKEFLT